MGVAILTVGDEEDTDITDTIHTRNQVPQRKSQTNPMNLPQTQTCIYTRHRPLDCSFRFLYKQIILSNLMQLKIVHALIQIGITQMAQRVALTSSMIVEIRDLSCFRRTGNVLQPNLGSKIAFWAYATNLCKHNIDRVIQRN